MNSCAARVAPEKAVFRPALPMHSLPEFTGEHMALTYREQLLHPNWQRRRLEIMKRDGFSCQVCQNDESTLHVHHRQYVKGRMAWEYSDSELVTLCDSCHEEAHANSAAFKDLLTKLRLDGPGSVVDALGMLSGWAHQACGYDLSEQFRSTPYQFTVGRIASLLDVCRMDVLFEVEAALSGLSRSQRDSALRQFAADIAANPPAIEIPTEPDERI